VKTDPVDQIQNSDYQSCQEKRDQGMQHISRNTQQPQNKSGRQAIDKAKNYDTLRMLFEKPGRIESKNTLVFFASILPVNMFQGKQYKKQGHSQRSDDQRNQPLNWVKRMTKSISKLKMQGLVALQIQRAAVSSNQCIYAYFEQAVYFILFLFHQ
jgi:hypothetical protein